MPAAVSCTAGAPHPYIQWVLGALGMRTARSIEFTPAESSVRAEPGSWVEFIRRDD